MSFKEEKGRVRKGKVGKGREGKKGNGGIEIGNGILKVREREKEDNR